MGMHPHIPLFDEDLSSPEKSAINMNIHAQRASHNDGEWDMIGGSDATGETDDETWTQEHVAVRFNVTYEEITYRKERIQQT
jgi:hypothetical protein